MSNKQVKSFLIGSLVGTVAGAVTALLFAPKPGKELRADIAKQAQQVGEKTVQAAEAVVDGSRKAAVLVGDKSKQVLASVKNGTSDLAVTVKSLIPGGGSGKPTETADESVLQAAIGYESADDLYSSDEKQTETITS